jgi:hypothetical protein
MAFARGARTGVLTSGCRWLRTRRRGGGELAVAVADQGPEAPVGVVEVHEQVARQLGQPRSGRVRGDAQDVRSAGGVLHDEERVEPVQGDRVEVEQVAGKIACTCAWRNWAQVGPARRGAGSIPAALRIVHTVQAPIWEPSPASSPWTRPYHVYTPRWDLGGQAHDEGADTGRDTGSACPDGLAHKLIRVGS